MESNNNKAKLMAGLTVAFFVILFPCVFIGQFLFTFALVDENYGLVALGVILACIGWALDIAVCAILLIAQWKLFVKMGEPGWKALIPFYNIYTMLEKAGYPGLLLLVILVPGVGSLALVVIMIMAWISIGEKFGKSIGWIVGFMIILNMIGFPYLAWSDDVFNPALGHQASPTNNY
ncbi:MAG: DUF5684 domain-containing protein [Saccharofermentans sp.]|nr:DUF5684 domain-containing protein [Saccharofermentans sp.]